MNPYLTNNTYVQDLSVHDQYMKPVSTNFKENLETAENQQNA
jgi:hypothetical protein